MLNQIVLGQWSAPDNKMIQHLREAIPNKVASTDELWTVLKTSPLRDKRYCSFHLFHRHFVTSHIEIERPPNWLELKDRMVDFFDILESTHTMHIKSPFMSYAYILKKTLQLFDLDVYTQFIKKSKIMAREQKYDKQFAECLRLMSLKNKHLGVWGVSEGNEQSRAGHPEHHNELPSQNIAPRV